MSENNKKSNYISSILEKIRTNKKIQFIIIFIFLVIILCIFLFGYDEKNSKNVVNTDPISSYVATLETKLSNVLSNVSGAGKVSVIISIESGMETVLAMQTTTKESASGQIETQTSPIIINGKTVVIKELYPKVKGVLIVAEGAKNISVMTKLQQATMSLLDIEINQIEILSMK
ncbi:MAG: hypothetical protein E7372_00645 [Clostridiales bacterium]|nr:hypothetical protein [Clostridiales bacterium]